MEEKQAKKTIAKNKEGYGYKYVELAEINKYCDSNNISYYQEVETNEINQKDYIITYVTKDGETTKHRGCQIVQAVLSGIKNPVQEYGSSLTYCRRYSLLMALGLATEDDDGASLTQEEEITEKEAKEYTMTFGKYKGKKIEDLDDDYIDWLLNNSKDKKLLKVIEIITGEVPLTEDEQKDSLYFAKQFEQLILETDTDREKLYTNYGVKKYDELTNEQVLDAIEVMKQKKIIKEKENKNDKSNN